MDEKSNPALATKSKLRLEGMHCSNCNALVEKQLMTVPGLISAKANFRRGKAEVTHRGDLDREALQRAVEEQGYRIVPSGDGSEDSSGKSKRYAEVAGAFLIVVALATVLNRLGLMPNSLAVGDNMGYGVIFLIGLVASVSSCMAVTGGLLVAIAAKYNAASPGLPGKDRWRTHLAFNAGRIVSYTLLGGAIGALGRVLMPSPEAAVLLTLIAAAIMILLGLQMVGLFPALRLLIPAIPQAVTDRINDLAVRQSRGGAFALGALTFFLPCGFTQALQLYVLTKGGFAVGALTMLAFSLGTLPALLSLSAITSFAKGAFQRRFMRFVGAAVILLGLLNIQYALVAADVGDEGIQQATQSAAPDELPQTLNYTPVPGKVQVVDMQVVGFNYVPNQFTVKQGVPVEWRIDARQAVGCGRFLFARRLGIRHLLSAEETTVITFLPDKVGQFKFNCAMGMMTPDSKFTVVPNV